MPLFKIQTSNYALQVNRPDTIWRCQVATSRAGSRGGGGLLTGNGSQVQVVPDHLLEFMVEGALLELQAEVVTQIRVQHLPCREEQNFGSVMGSTLQTHRPIT